MLGRLVTSCALAVLGALPSYPTGLYPIFHRWGIVHFFVTLPRSIVSSATRSKLLDMT